MIHCINIDTNVAFFFMAFAVAMTSNPATITYIQVKANGNADCAAWKVTMVTLSFFKLDIVPNYFQTLPTQDVVYKSIKDEMEVFCKCNFTIQSLNLTCSDKTSVTLRGIIDKALLSYLELWVATKATISAPGVTLTVDSTCAVQIQSLDDPLCLEALSSESLASSYRYVIVGMACGGVFLIAIIGIVVGIVLVRQQRKRKLFKIA